MHPRIPESIWCIYTERSLKMAIYIYTERSEGHLASFDSKIAAGYIQELQQFSRRGTKSNSLDPKLTPLL
jgi:hypothetical protein